MLNKNDLNYMTGPRSLGQKGEDKAVEFLEKKGYKILHRNWKSPGNEIDIIAENEEYIVFVEVKTRTSGYLMEPQSAVNREKRRSIQNAADTYIKRYEIDKQGRFDIIKVIAKGDSLEIDHIPDAFYPTLK
jgi:putative endonuclease